MKGEKLLPIISIEYFGVTALAPIEIYCVDGLVMPYVLIFSSY